MEALFIVNPRSADGTTGSQWARLERMITREGLKGEARFTEGPGHATALVRTALAEGHRLIVAVGGDGTVNEVVNGFFSPTGDALAPDAELGLLCRGTGCDFIKSLGIPKREDLALQRIRQGSSRPIDLGRADFRDAAGRETLRYFDNIAEAGLGGAVAGRANRSSKALGGFASFLVSTLATVATHRSQPMTVQWDDEAPLTLTALNVVVGNGRYFGGGMHILPQAELDDGLFDVLLMGDLGRGELVRNLAKVYTGKHLTHPKVRHLRARRVKITSTEPVLLDLDGEQPGLAPVTFTLQPAALRVRR